MNPIKFLLIRSRVQLSPRRIARNHKYKIKNWIKFWRSYFSYYNISKDLDINFDFYPCIEEWTISTYIEPTYFYQDSWAFEHIVRLKPNSHLDVGSHNKYVALLSKVVPVTMVDIRPLSLDMESIKFVEGSVLNLNFPDKSLESVSSLCVIEHIGLGRYGDPLDVEGSIKAFKELMRVIKPGGNLFISFPIEENPVTYFNAHRAFNEKNMIDQAKGFEILDKKYIYGSNFTDEYSPEFGVGCYWLQREN